MGLKPAFLIQVIVFLCFHSGAIAGPYEVREGDTLSTIARAHFQGPLYGDDGALHKLLDINNQEITNPDVIFPGQVVHFEKTEEDRSLASDPADNSATQTPEESPTPVQATLPAPSASSEPEKVVTKIEEPPLNVNGPSPFSLLSITPSFQYSNFKVTDKQSGGSAHILSDLYPEVTLGWQQAWTKDTETHFHFGFGYYTTEPLQSRDLNPHSSSLTDFGFGFRSNVSDRFRLGLDFDSVQALLVRGISFSELTTDRIQANELSAAIRYNIASSGRFTLSTEIKGGLIAPAQFSGYSMTTGESWSARLFLDQEIRAGVLHGGIFWNQSTYNTTITTQTDSVIGFEFGFGWNIGK